MFITERRGLRRVFLSSPLKYDIDDLFFIVNYCQIFLFDLSIDSVFFIILLN